LGPLRVAAGSDARFSQPFHLMLPLRSGERSRRRPVVGGEGSVGATPCLRAPKRPRDQCAAGGRMVLLTCESTEWQPLPLLVPALSQRQASRMGSWHPCCPANDRHLGLCSESNPSPSREPGNCRELRGATSAPDDRVISLHHTRHGHA
jgi:hypothetical protein